MNGIEKAKDFLRLNLFFFVVGAACVVYIVRGLINIVETGKSVLEIFADGSIAAMFGFFISKLLSLQGLAKGERDPKVAQTNALHSKRVESVSNYIYLLDGWCESKNEESLKTAQCKLLARAAVSYEEFICGKYKLITVEGEKNVCEEELSKPKKKAVKRARRLKLTPLTASSLTSDGGTISDPYNFGSDKKAYSRKHDGKQILSKCICGLLFGYYGVTLISEFNFANLIWTSVQVVIFLVMGMISYLQSYFFVVDEYRHRIIKKIDNLEKFENQVKEKNNEQVLDNMVQG